MGGTLTDPEQINQNFEYLDDKIDTVNSKIYTNNSSFDSKFITVNNTILEMLDKLRPIGQPILRLDDTLFNDEIRLEGEIVSRVEYANLFEKYGTTYGAGDGVTTFQLPDFRDRAFWGAADFGYLEAALPNIKGSLTSVVHYGTGATGSEALTATMTGGGLAHGSGGYHTYTYTDSIDASRCSGVYKNNCNTVQPAAIKVRVVTRYR